MTKERPILKLEKVSKSFQRGAQDTDVLRDVDLAVIRRVGLGGERAIELRLEVFNLLNTTNFAPRAAQYGAASIGTITTALDPRVVQLAAKFWF